MHVDAVLLYLKRTQCVTIIVMFSRNIWLTIYNSSLPAIEDGFSTIFICSRFQVQLKLNEHSIWVWKTLCGTLYIDTFLALNFFNSKQSLHKEVTVRLRAKWVECGSKTTRRKWVGQKILHMKCINCTKNNYSFYFLVKSKHRAIFIWVGILNSFY